MANETANEALARSFDATSDALEVVVKVANAAPIQLIKTVAASTAPEALAVSTKFRSMTFGGLKAARTNNAGTVYLGLASGNDTQPYVVSPGEWHTLTAPLGQQYDLADFYLDVATNGDGLIIWYS